MRSHRFLSTAQYRRQWGRRLHFTFTASMGPAKGGFFHSASAILRSMEQPLVPVSGLHTCSALLNANSMSWTAVLCQSLTME